MNCQLISVKKIGTNDVEIEGKCNNLSKNEISETNGLMENVDSNKIFDNNDMVLSVNKTENKVDNSEVFDCKAFDSEITDKLMINEIKITDVFTEKVIDMSVNNKYSSKKPLIFLRHDQTFDDRNNKYYLDDNVIILAPDWVRKGLKILSEHIPKETEFNVIDGEGKRDILVIKNELSLKNLVSIARNERSNTSGKIMFEYYEPLITDKAIIYALKDLVRQCVIVGMDKSIHFGGYKSKIVESNEKVIVIDLIGLQFQTKYNTGRLVLIGENQPKGLLDDMIYENIVEEKKKSYSEVSTDRSERYIRCLSEDIYFDTHAYKKFVANDLVVSVLAADSCYISHDYINFKFLKYGTGFFAGQFQPELVNNINSGILMGLQNLFKLRRINKIKSFEFPFYEKSNDIIKICKQNNIECKFSMNDALKPIHKHRQSHRYITATTNCADPHVVTGNEMNYHSVDAAIAENLKSKANKFSPLINRYMRDGFINLETGAIELGLFKRRTQIGDYDYDSKNGCACH